MSKFPSPFPALIPRAQLPFGGLALATSIGLALLAVKIIASGRLRDFYLAWNLFLAWLPLLFAWAASREGASRRILRPRFWGLALLWVLFFPNAPYIFTDLVHLPPREGFIYWIDMVLILLFALTGTVAGFVSLYLMHGIVRRRHGWTTGWGFVVAMAGLTGLGVYLGRFLRWNSWDALLNPLSLMTDITSHFLQWPGYKHGPAFLILFSMFVFVSYLLLYLLVYLPRPLPAPRKPHFDGEFQRAIERDGLETNPNLIEPA